jgi:hypothetical protein
MKNGKVKSGGTEATDKENRDGVAPGAKKRHAK